MCKFSNKFCIIDAALPTWKNFVPIYLHFQTTEKLTEIKNVLSRIPRDFWMCDSDKQIEGTTFVQMTQLLQVIISIFGSLFIPTPLQGPVLKPSIIGSSIFLPFIAVNI